MNKEDIINLELSLLPWMGRTMKDLDMYISDKFKESGIELTKVQWILLKKLKEVDGQPQHNLAFLTNRNKASLARLLTTMERKNLVARIPSKSDHRRNHIYLTKHGNDMLKKAMPVMQDMINHIQKNISKEDIRAVIQIMKKVMQNIHSEELVATITK
jgi:DNA-binding MarR family transcriptional regulator